MSSSSVSSDSSPASASPPSTAPSTPTHAEPPAYFLVTHAPSVTFLKALPVQKGCADRILFLTGCGRVSRLLAQASRVLDDKSLLDVGKWESVKAEDGGGEVAYYRTKTEMSSIGYAPNEVDIESMRAQTQNVRGVLLCLGPMFTVVAAAHLSRRTQPLRRRIPSVDHIASSSLYCLSADAIHPRAPYAYLPPAHARHPTQPHRAPLQHALPLCVPRRLARLGLDHPRDDPALATALQAH